MMMMRRRRRNKGLQRKGDGDCGVVILKWEGGVDV